MSAWTVPDSLFRSSPRFFGERDIHREQNPRARIDGHRHRDVFEIDAVEQRLHVGERVDGDAFAPDFAFAHRMVAVVAHQRRHIEIGREPGLPLRDQELEALVGVLAGAEARDLAHGPGAAAIHGRVGAARERIAAGQPDILDRRLGDVGRGVGALHRDVADGEELLLALGLFLQERGDLVRFPVGDLAGELIKRSWIERLVHGSSSGQRRV